MGYTFSGGRFTIEKGKEAAVLRKLRAYLDKAEPKLVYWLVHTWNTQSRAITYKELREAILRGDIDESLIDEWQQDYSRFVSDYLEPAWIDAINKAVAEIQKKYPEWRFDPFAEGVVDWVRSRAAEFVTSSTATQIMGLRAVVTRAAVLEDLTVDQLARAIRPMVGLYHQQSIANLNYYNSLIHSGTAEKKALDLATRYAARQHRYRGYLIARTELAYAYNRGSYEGTKQAQAAGYIGEVVKVWSTAEDERTCEVCGSLEGKQIAMDADFDFTTKLPDNTIRRTPPAHPSCRCAVEYREIRR